MKTYFLILIAGLTFISCKCRKTVENKNVIGISKNQYEIIKIDSIESVYLIYAKKGDSIVKIASKIENTTCINKIKKGDSLNLSIKSVFNETFYQRRNIAGVNFNGTMIRLKEEGVLWDLFISDDIKGLCIIKQ
jgi:hypothetical protein